MFYVYVLYYLVMNVLAFVLYAVDKKRAILHRWRIPEVVLLGVSALGGCVGAYLAMRIFRHKIRYPIFSMGVPALILVHGCLGLYLAINGHLSLPAWIQAIL